MKDRIALGNGKNNILKFSTLSESLTLSELITLLNSGAYVDLTNNNIVTGENVGVSEIGTPLNVGTLLSSSVATSYGLNPSTATVSEVLNVIYENSIKRTDSYIAFCGSVNANQLDSAFGKNNTEYIKSVGLQMAMYSWFKGDSKTTYPYTNLIMCDTLDDCVSNPLAFSEILSNLTLCTLLSLSPYAMRKITVADYLLKIVCSNVEYSNNMYSAMKNYATDINTTLSTSALFTKELNTTFISSEATTAIFDARLNTNSIIIPTSFPNLSPTYNTSAEGRRFAYNGSDGATIYTSSSQDLNNVIALSNLVSMRGIRYSVNNVPLYGSARITCNVYTVI